jgi:peptidoglycan-associated lipoprotein
MRNWTFAVLVAVLVVLGGCKSTETQAPAPVEEGAGATTGATPGGAATTGVATPGVSGTATPGAGGALDPRLRDPRNILSKRLVYFDFDSFSVKEEYRPLVEAHAKYLQQNRSARVTLQGHADERGSREYNIGLGERRAQAVRRVLQLGGAGAQQLTTVSYGEERPAASGSDEESWRLNRRVELVYR